MPNMRLAEDSVRNRGFSPISELLTLNSSENAAKNKLVLAVASHVILDRWPLSASEAPFFGNVLRVASNDDGFKVPGF